MTKSIRISCIIPSLCSKDSYSNLKKSLTSLILASEKARVSLSIIVVTNGTNLRLVGIRNKINRLIRYKNKFSFADMNNLAIDKSLSQFKPDWILLINDDAYVNSAFFEQFKKKNQADIIIPLIYETKSSAIDSFGVEYFTSGYAKNSNNLTDKTQLAAAACLLIKSSFLKSMKLKYSFYFNKILGSYLEDVEFSIRAKAIGAVIVKNEKMIAHHSVSYSSGIKSYFVMYQTYRNCIWLITLTWPFKTIVGKIPTILLIQILVFLSSLVKFGPLLYVKLIIDTLYNLPQLLNLRRSIISAYTLNFKFEQLFSEYAFRTYSKFKIKI